VPLTQRLRLLGVRVAALRAVDSFCEFEKNMAASPAASACTATDSVAFMDQLF
jgi:hypothetical protein